MKCPKCGYLGFETTDRCRNCGYDFSLAAPAPAVELPLRGVAAPDAPLVDLELREDEPPTADIAEPPYWLSFWNKSPVGVSSWMFGCRHSSSVGR